MYKKSFFSLFLLPILLHAQLGNVPYSVWNDPATGTSPEPIYASASTSSSQITTLGLSDYLVAKNFVQNGRDWFQVDLPSTTGSAITGYCAAWYGPSPFTFRTLPNCNKQILTVTATVLNVRNTTNTTGFVTIGGGNCQVFSGQKFVYTGNAPVTANGYTWYEIYLPDNCSQSIGYLANVSSSSIQIANSNSQVLPQVTLNQPSASDLTSNSITLNWNTISGISSYTINYNGTSVNATSSPYTLSSLASNTSYNISVSYNFPYNQNCSSTQSNTISASTIGSSCTTPSTPTNPTITGQSSNSISLSWSASSNAVSYEVVDCNSNLSYPTTSTSTTISGLSASTNYSFKVRAIGNGTNCYSSFTNCISGVTTSGCATPNASFILPSAGSVNTPILVTNSSTGTAPLSYLWTTSPSSGVVFSPSATSASPSITFPTAGSYTVSVTVSNSCGSNNNQAVTTISNSCTPPTTPTSATASQLTISAGQTTTLQVNGGALNSATSWSWYTGSCGGTFVGTGATLPVIPATTTTYYVDASACGVTTTCKSVQINVSNNPTPSVTLTYPNGGETWTLYSPQFINANVIGTYYSRKIEISYDGGVNWNLITGGNLVGSNINYNWTPSYQAFNTCKVKVTVYFGINQSVYDISDANFSIVTNPNYNQPFELNNNGKSHLFWPFPNSNWHNSKYNLTRNGWIRRGEENFLCFSPENDCDYGMGGHFDGDFYAQDWNKYENSSAVLKIDDDCDKEFRSPLYGKVIKVGKICNFSNCSSNTYTCNGDANAVFVESMNMPNFIFGILHLKDNIPVNVGDIVQPSQVLGYVGNTGATLKSHAHCVLYKHTDLDFYQSFSGKQFLLATSSNDGLNLNPTSGINFKNGIFASEFAFDAVTQAGTGGSLAPQIVSNSSKKYLCPNDSMILTAPLSNKYFWNTGDTTRAIVIDTAGIYSCILFDSLSSSSLCENFEIRTIDSSSFYLNVKNTLCGNNSAVISTSFYPLNTDTFFMKDNFNHYLWSNGSQSPYIEVTQSGSYTLTFTDGNNCFTTVKSITVNQTQSPNQPTISNNSGNLASSSINGCTYQWFLNGNLIGNGQYLNSDTIGSGYYTVQATNQNGCSALSNPVFVQTTGISYLKGDDIYIYPNPTTSNLNIRVFDNFGKGKYEILSSLGQKIIEGDLLNSKTNSVDISSLATGVYFIQLTNGRSKFNYRFFKE